MRISCVAIVSDKWGITPVISVTNAYKSENVADACKLKKRINFTYLLTYSMEQSPS